MMDADEMNVTVQREEKQGMPSGTPCLITDLKKIDQKRFCLYIDYEPFGPVYASDIKRMKLKVGEETEKEKLLCFKKEQYYRRAMNKAVSMLQYSEKCEYDIRKKLDELSYDSDVADRTVNQLKEYGYLDDARYASSYVRSHIQKKSRREIAIRLSAKKIPDEVIEMAFDEYDLPDEKTVICRILSKRYSPEELRANKERAAMYFVRKGYPYKQVMSCIDETLS